MVLRNNKQYTYIIHNIITALRCHDDNNNFIVGVRVYGVTCPGGNTRFYTFKGGFITFIRASSPFDFDLDLKSFNRADRGDFREDYHFKPFLSPPTYTRVVSTFCGSYVTGVFRRAFRDIRSRGDRTTFRGESIYFPPITDHNIIICIE